ncbi:TPA: hypothetical protein VCH52_001706 [Streptococcus pyogenes]|nr:hypothetical protein [Streptococcus pyogenes]
MTLTVTLANQTIAHYKLSEFEVTEDEDWLMISDKDGSYTIKYRKDYINTIEWRN